MCIIYPSRARPWLSTSTLVLRSCQVFVLVQSRPMKKSCPSKGACFSKAHNNIHAKSCVSKFCLGRRTKQPEVDKPLSVAHVVKLLSPYGKFHRSTNCKILWRQQDHNPLPGLTMLPPSLPNPSPRHWPRVAGPSATFERGSAQRRIPNVPAKRHGPPRGPARCSLMRTHTGTLIHRTG